MTSERKNDLNEIVERGREAYKTIFENLPFVAFTLDRDGRLLEANEYTEKLIGLRAKDAIGKRFSELGLLGKRDLLKAFMEFRKNLRGGVTEKTVYSVKLKDGREILLELIGIPIRENGKVTKVLDIGSNITERKKIEEELREKEEKYRFISESTRDVILILDKTGKILFANKRAVEASGYAENEMVGKSIASFLTKDSIKTAFYVMAKEFLDQPQKKIELKIKTKSGEIRYLEVDEGSIPVREKGKTTGILVTGRDITERKKAEEELRNSEERFRMIFEYAPDACYLNDMKGTLTEGNLAAEKLTGYKRSELIGKSFLKLKLLPLEQIPKAASLLAKNALGRSTGPDEFILNRKDGSKINVEIMTYPVKIGEQKLALGIARDITERKKTEELRREGEEQFRKLFSEMPDAVIILDRKGTFLETSNEVENVSGYRKEDVVGKNLFAMDILDAKTKALVIKKLVLHFSGGKITPFEIDIRRKDGEIATLEINPQIIDYVGKKADMIVLRDLTERKKAEEKLKESEERYRIQFEEALDAIFIADAKTGIIVDCNRTATELVERSKAELVGQHQRMLHPPEDIKGQFSETFRKHISGAEGRPLEARVITKSGKLKDVTIKANLIQLKEKKLIQGIFRDITERKEAEEKVMEREGELRTILDSVQAGIVIIDAETHNIIDVNPIAVKMIGASKEKIVGSVCHGYICPAEMGKCPITDLGQKVDNSERVLLKANGEKNPILKTVTPVMLKDRKCLLESFVDLTERKSVEENLKKRTEDLEAFNKLSVGRELKMVELKKRISELEGQLKEKAK